MKIYIITNSNNLKVLSDTLGKKFNTINIQGTNDIMKGVETVSSKHITEEYDLFLIMDQKFVEQDLLHKGAISDKLNKACIYALKDLPIYFMVNRDNKEYAEDLKKLLTGKNIRLYPYKKLQTSLIEEIIKEVLVLSGTNKIDKTKIQKEILQEKKRREEESYESHIDRIYARRSKRNDIDFSKLNRIKGIIEQFRPVETKVGEPLKKDDSSKIIEEIKQKLFADTSISSDIKKEDVKVKSLNHEEFHEQISPTKLKKTLAETNPDYHDYTLYMDDIKKIIEKVKESNEPNKHEMVLDLIREKAKVNNEMNLLFTEFLTEVTQSTIDFVTEEYNKEINELHDFGDMLDYDVAVGSKLEDIDRLKKIRNEMKSNVGYMIKELYETTNIVNKVLSNAGSQYLLETKDIENELLDYANQNNITLTEIGIERNEMVLTKLKESYDIVRNSVTGLMTSAEQTMSKMVELIQKDEEIIEKQDEVIDILSTQKTKKIITVDNLLQTKLIAIIGPEGVGKTHTGLNMAYAYSKFNKTLLVDLNLYNPNLVYYNNEKEETESKYWYNKNTISLEEFIKIPIGKTMYKQLPYYKNLTIVQPLDYIDLNDYENIINPKVFSIHLEDFLNSLGLFYEKIIIILPFDLNEFEEILPSIGTLYMVNDYDPTNFRKSKQIIETYGTKLDVIPVKNFIANKYNRNVNLELEKYLETNGVSIRDFKFFKIPQFQESPQQKIEGKIPYLNNVTVRKVFEELIKNS